VTGEGGEILVRFPTELRTFVDEQSWT